MPTWAEDMESLIDDCQDNLGGEAVTYERLADAVVTTPTGIVSSGGQLEQAVPGAKLSIFFKLSDFAVEPVKGDTVTRGGNLYVVAEDPRDGKDSAGGITLLLRYVREAIT